MNRLLLFKSFLLFLILSLFFACQSDKPHKKDYVVVGISADIETLNPLYSISVDEGYIAELLFLNLAGVEWNNDKNELEFIPMLAESWQWSEDSTSIIFKLRKGVKWTDGTEFTAEDVVFSFDIYSDPEVQSRFYGMFDFLFTNEEGGVDTAKSFDVINNYQIKINFSQKNNSIFESLMIPILPSNSLSKLDRNDIQTSEFNYNPVTNGPFKLKKWERTQSIQLVKNENSFLQKDSYINELILKIVPEYNSRIIQLKKGEIDVIETVKSEDVKIIESQYDIKVYPIKGREYEYVGWNNIDPVKFTEENILLPHPLFGSKKVRRALSYAINREEILNEFLNGFGELAAGPVSSIFKKYIDENLQPLSFNPEEAKRLLEQEGWIDEDRNGIREKNGKNFSFKLKIPSGNTLREFAATVIKNNLQQVGINVEIEAMEFGNFMNDVYERKTDAWIAAWYVPIPLALKDFWFSDPEKTPLNFQTYQNQILDQLLLSSEKESGEKLVETFKKIQQILYEDQPVTFLYWVDNLVAANNRIKNLKITPLGTLNNCWRWELKKD